MTTLTLALLAAVLAACLTTSHTQTQCIGSLDIIFAVDGSNSMNQGNFDRQITSLVNLVTKLSVSEAEVHIGLVLFSSTVTDVIQLSGNKNQILQSIRSLQYPDEQTRTDLAIDEAVNMFNRLGRGGSVPKLMMVITDGASTIPSQTQVSAARAKAQNITIFAVGVTNQVDVKELQALASKPEQVIITADFTTLEVSLNEATNRACVDLDCESAQVDLVFVLDSSSGVGEANFKEMLNFVTDFLFFAFVDNGNFRVGVMTYGDDAYVQFQMSQYPRNKATMMSALKSLVYRPGGSNKAAALRALRENMYTVANGDRTDVPNVVIFLSASDSNINTAQTITEAEAARAFGMQIFGVGIGQGWTQELDGIASRPLSENRFTIDSFYQLRPIITEVYKKFNRFCESTTTPASTSPPPVPACFMGVTDLLLVVDVSNNAEQLSRFQYTGDFARVKNGITKMLEIILDPSVTNTGVRTGLVTYSDNFQVITNVTAPNSVSLTAAAVNNLPNGLRQGGANLASALRAIVLPPRVSDYRSYVAIIAPESSYTADQTNVLAEIARLKALDYTIVPFVIAENNRLDVQTLMREASGAQYFFDFNNYSQLEAALKNFTRDGLCKGYVGPKAGGLCDNSGHRVNGMSVVAHPMDCDKYVQCYYNSLINLDIGVVRTCPRGLHWNQANKTCGQPSEIRCPNDRCREDCEPYKMEGACGAYWDCENGVSTPKCCQQFFSFIPGVGCQLDYTCKDECGPEKWCGLCQKKPNWLVAAGYDVQLMNGNMGWLPRPCFYEDFDVVDCDCTAPRNQVCPADRDYNFNDASTVRAVQDGTREGIRVSSVSSTTQSLVLNNKSTVHVDVNKMESGDEPFVIEFLYKEKAPFSPYGETLLSSGLQCGSGNALVISANDQFVFAELRSSDGKLAEVKVPTKGFSVSEFKNLTLTYEEGILSLSVKGSQQQYIAQTHAPAHMCFSCGLDIGAGLNKNSFEGEVQKIAVHSCSFAKLY